MTIEAALAETTAAIKELTAISTRLYDLRSATTEEIKTLAAGAKAAPKAAAKKTEEAAAGTETIVETPAVTKTEDPAAGTNRLAEVQAACAKYAGGTDRPEERTARMEKLTWLFGKVGASKLAEVPVGKEAAVIKAVTQLIEAGDLTEAPDDASNEDEGDLLAA